MTLVKRRDSSEESVQRSPKSEQNLIDLVELCMVEQAPDKSEFDKLRNYWDNLHERLDFVCQKLRDREQSMNSQVKKDVRSSYESGSSALPT